jgi:hypothetical protein
MKKLALAASILVLAACGATEEAPAADTMAPAMAPAPAATDSAAAPAMADSTAMTKDSAAH